MTERHRAWPWCGPAGRHSASPYTLRAEIAGGDANALRTVILVNRSRTEALYGAASTAALLEHLYTLAGHATVGGVVVQVDADPNVAAAYATWDALRSSSSRANAVADAIKTLLNSYVASYPGVEQNGYLVIVGDDRLIPFRRVNVYSYARPYDFYWTPESRYAAQMLRTDQRSTIGWALADNQTLTDDFYADLTPISWRADHDLYIPDLAVGRLVETPEEMITAMDAYLARGGQVNLTSAAVSGYDFILDIGQQECSRWTADGVAADCTLVRPSFNSAELIAKMLSPAFNVAAINGHASHFGFQAPDRTALLAGDVTAAAGDQAGRLVYTLGCQSGLNVPPGESNEVDLAQAFAQRGATYVGNTGYGYGLKNTVGLSEEVMQLFTEELTEGSATTVGYALTRAKQQYRLLTSHFGYYDEKVSIESTLYGLPMLRVNTPGGTARQMAAASRLERAGVKVTRTARVSPARGRTALAALL